MDPKRHEVEFEVGNREFLNVTLRHGISRIEIKEKLAPRYIGPFEITTIIGVIVYHFTLSL